MYFCFIDNAKAFDCVDHNKLWKILKEMGREPGRAPPRHTHGDLTPLAPHERLPEILVVPREKTPTGAAARGNP